MIIKKKTKAHRMHVVQNLRKQYLPLMSISSGNEHVIDW